MTIELISRAIAVLARAEAFASGELSHLRTEIHAEIVDFGRELAEEFEIHTARAEQAKTDSTFDTSGTSGTLAI